MEDWAFTSEIPLQGWDRRSRDLLIWNTKVIPSLPSLAWLAECTAGAVTLYHGAEVEAGPAFLFEGAWAGFFDQQGFASAATVMGSGAALTDDGVLFVPPSHTLEGLYHHAGSGGFTISNSLVLLLQRLGAIPAYDPHGGRRFASAVLGIEDYERHLVSTDRGPVERLLHGNLLWRPDGRTEELRKPVLGPFPDFGTYHDGLRSELAAIFGNAADPARRHRFRPVSTCSSGYDSTACLVLGRELGCDRAVTLTTARGGEDDSGAEIAALLGVELQPFERMPRATPEQLNEFVATGMGGEDVIYSAFGSAVAGSVLLTGFHGDKIWSRDATPNAVLARGDISGSSMGEFRRRTGFIHAPVPFIGALRHAEIAAISNSAEMAPWAIGGGYDRPIPRRIAEEAGVPRSAFGTAKKAASMLLFRDEEAQPEDSRDQAASLSALPPAERAAIRLRERLFEPRLRAAYRLDRAPLRPLAHRLRDLLAADPRLFEHDRPTASLEFRSALAAIRARYSAVGTR
jgi:hypothetical protein